MQSVVELRRAVDLQSLPQVDDDKIGFVGYSAGAGTGAILAGVEPRIKAFVLMSGGEDSVDEFMTLVQPEQREVRPLLDDTDGLKYIAQASPSKLFFQAGLKDSVVPKDALETLIKAGSEPKKVGWYDAGHDLAVPKAQRDQLDWLAEELGSKAHPSREQRPGRRRGWRKTGCCQAALVAPRTVLSRPRISFDTGLPASLPGNAHRPDNERYSARPPRIARCTRRRRSASTSRSPGG